MSRSPLPSATPTNRRPPEDGTRYRVRDRDGDPPIVRGDGEGQGLTYGDATKLRDHITFTQKIRGMIVEPMPRPEAEVTDDLSVPTEPAPQRVESAQPIRGTDYQVASAMTATTLAADGTITKIPSGHQLLVNGQDRRPPARVHKNDVVECRSLAPPVAQARSAADDAVAQVIAQKRRVPMDVTVRQTPPRQGPPPPDLTVSHRPVVVRLGAPRAVPPKPLPSPLKVATLEDGEALADDAITDAELPDLAGDLGGGPSDADVEHAKRQAEQDRTG